MEKPLEQAIRDHWDAKAEEQVPEGEVTHRDIWQRWLEIETLRDYLESSDRVLDVGCGNGFTTRRLAPCVQEIVGIDYSEEMIGRANAAAAGGKGRMTFRVLDVRALNSEAVGVFDVAVSERCLINLTSWEEQQDALRNIASVLRPGGRFLFMEGSRQGRDRLNQLRVEVGLPAMPPVWHNVDFDEDQLLAFLEPSFEVEKRLDFGVYDFVARVVHPLTVAPDEPRYDAKINEVAARLARHRQDFEGVSRVVVLVLRKR